MDRDSLCDWLSLITFDDEFRQYNYDLTKYLPDTAESAIGLDVMRDKFGYPGTARVMVKDVSLYEAKQYKDEILAEIDGVDQVLWCDSSVNIYAGEDFINESDIKGITIRTETQSSISRLSRRMTPAGLPTRSMR